MADVFDPAAWKQQGYQLGVTEGLKQAATIDQAEVFASGRTQGFLIGSGLGLVAVAAIYFGRKGGK